MSRSVLVVLVLAAAAAPTAAPAADKPADAACAQASPSAAPCIFVDKANEEAASQCRAAGAPDADCVMPAGHDVLASELDAYQRSWVHQAAEFQYALGNTLPLRDAQWLGTHNSFNSENDSTTLSHMDSNQQLTLTQQLDADMRSLELDVHYVPSVEAGGADAVVVCHGRGPDQEHFGCTNEPLLSDVLPEIATWLDEHTDQVLLLYIEDELGAAQGYADTVATTDRFLGDKVYKPQPAAGSACEELPLGISRADVLAAHRQVVVVGNCQAGWSSDVFGWDQVHRESGSTPEYQPFPACDATYGPSVYADHLVRYFEDSTFVSAAVSPSESPAQDRADSLTPDKVASMVRCGVNLFGFDQLLPDDGRIEASIWSWAPDQPDASVGQCAVQRGDGRWVSADCGGSHPAACRTAAGGWTLTATAVTFADAPAACSAASATFDEPRAGDQNSQLRAVAGDATVWIDQQLLPARAAAAIAAHPARRR
jgi:hypothetical protein